MIKLSKILSEIKSYPDISPKANLERFVKTYIKEIRNIINIMEGAFDFDYYVDLNSPIKFTPSGDPPHDPDDYLILHNDNEDCLGIGFTADMDFKLEGEGPVGDGIPIQIGPYQIQYQTLAC